MFTVKVETDLGTVRLVYADEVYVRENPDPSDPDTIEIQAIRSNLATELVVGRDNFRHYQVAYIMNAQGKTVQRVNPPPITPPPVAA